MANGSETPQYKMTKGLPPWVWVLLVIPILVAPFIKRKPPEVTPSKTSLNMTLTDLQGKKTTLADYKGKVVLFSFWASWCAPCLAEMPSLKKLETKFSGRPFQLLLVNVEEVPADTKEVLASVPGKVLFGGTTDILHSFGVQSIPFTLLVDAEGNIQNTFFGEQDWENPMLVKEVEKWVGVAAK
jgi:thiol-disulfide isomerase/thioredoxin